MDNKKLVLKLIEENNGVLVSEKAAQYGINNKTLQRLHNSGDIERIEYGIYVGPNHIEDEYMITQYRCKKGIFSHETALFLHDLIDRTPFKLMLTIPSGYNTRLLKERNKYRFFYISKKLYNMGKNDMMSPFGNEIAVYDIERTICDCIRKKDQLDTYLVNTAIKRYMSGSNADYAKLLNYAGIFKVRAVVRQYMEVLS